MSHSYIFRLNVITHTLTLSQSLSEEQKTAMEGLYLTTQSFAELIITKTHLFHFFLPLLRCEEGLVGPRLVVGKEENVALENPLDVGQVWHPSRCPASLHAAAQAPPSPAAQHEAHEGQGELLRPGLQGCV